MRIHGHASGPGRLVPGMTLATALAITLAACSSSASTTATQTTGTAPSAGTSTASAAAASTPTAGTPAASSSAPAAVNGLSGNWTGQYSGASQGHFTLQWTQSGSALSGTIRLETDGVTMPIQGTVVGSSIRFGTVGSSGITYTGMVSGNSMSGSYKLVAANGTTFSGPWSAARSS
jgi:hypothetical protein